MPLYSAGLWLAVKTTPARVQGAAGVVQLVGGDQAEQLDVGAAVGGAAGEGLGEFGGGGAHVAADQDGLACQAEHVHEGGAHGLDDFGGDGSPTMPRTS